MQVLGGSFKPCFTIKQQIERKNQYKFNENLCKQSLRKIPNREKKCFDKGLIFPMLGDVTVDKGHN